MALAGRSPEPHARALSPEDEAMSDSGADSQVSSSRSSPSTHHHVGQFAAINGHADDRYEGPASSARGAKRRRSDPDTIVVDSTRHLEGHAPSRYDYSPPSMRPEQPQRVADHALRVLHNSAPNGHSYPTTGTTDVRWNGHYTNGDPEIRSDERGSSGDHGQSPRAQKAWTESDENGHPSGNDSYSMDASSAHAGSKRKRNFSNRTKTGCLTCRRRKKKCDETRPECNNCSRGGFTCAGYSTSRGQPLWNKSSPINKPPVPLQAKDVLVRPPDRDMRTSEAGPHVAQPSVAQEGARHQLIAVDDGDRIKYTTSPDSGEPRSQPSYSGPQWPQQPQPPTQPQPGPAVANVDHSRRYSVTQPRHDQPLPPAPQHDTLGRSESTRPAVPPQPTPPQYPVYPPHPPNPPPPQYWAPPPPQYHRPYTSSNRQDSYSSSSHGRMSSSLDHHKAGSKTFTNEEIERSRMLRHSSYNHLDPTLENERSRCQRALVRYNNAREYDSSLSEIEIHAMLEKVVDPSKDDKHLFLAPCKEKGFVRVGARLQRPFRCTYGYNLKVLEDVYIGEDCLIDDAASVEIGPRTWIGPGVTILTTNVSTDMVDRKGVKAKWLAKPVTIAAEVVIGAHAKIFPGVTLERGATVEPFAVVKQSLQPNLYVTASQGQILLQ